MEYFNLRRRCEELEKENSKLKSVLERVKHLLLSEENNVSSDFALLSSPPSTLKKFAPTKTSSVNPSPILGSSAVGVKRRLDLSFQNAQDLNQTAWEWATEVKHQTTNNKNSNEISGGSSMKHLLAEEIATSNTSSHSSSNPPSTLETLAPPTTSPAVTSPILGSSARSKRRVRIQQQVSLADRQHSQDPDETFWEVAEDKPQLTEQKMKQLSPESLVQQENKENGAAKKKKDQDPEIAAIFERLRKLPKYSGLELKAKSEVSKNIRGVERRQLPGWACYQCEEYYNATGVTPETIHCVSRHRSTHPRLRSPKSLWSLDM